MKRQQLFLIYLLVPFLLAITTFTGCDKVKDATATYTAKITPFASDTVTQNPFISWSLDPMPSGKLKSVLRIAKLLPGDTPESALERNGTDITFISTSTIQYLYQPVLDTNESYSIMVTILDNGDGGGQKYAKTQPNTFKVKKAHGELGEPIQYFTARFYSDTPDLPSNWFIEFTPHDPWGYEGDLIDWKLVEVVRCNFSFNQPPCEWVNPVNRLNAINSASLAHFLPDPIMIAQETFGPLLPGNGHPPFIINVGMLPHKDSSYESAYLLYLSSKSHGYYNIFYTSF